MQSFRFLAALLVICSTHAQTDVNAILNQAQQIASALGPQAGLPSASEIQQSFDDARDQINALPPDVNQQINAVLGANYTDFLTNWTMAWTSILNGSNADFQNFLNQISNFNWTTYTEQFLPGLLNSSYLNETYTGLYTNSSGDFNALLAYYTGNFNGTLTKQQQKDVEAALDRFVDPLSRLLEGYGMLAVGTAQLLNTGAINGTLEDTVSAQLQFLNASLAALNSSIVSLYNDTGMMAPEWLASVKQQVADYETLFANLGNDTEQVKLAAWTLVQNSVTVVANASIEIFEDCNGLEALVYGYLAGNLSTPLYSELLGAVAGGQAVVTVLEAFVQSNGPSVTSSDVSTTVSNCAVAIINTSLVNGVPSDFQSQLGSCNGSADAYLTSLASDKWDSAYEAISNALDSAFSNSGTIWGFNCAT